MKSPLLTLGRGNRPDRLEKRVKGGSRPAQDSEQCPLLCLEPALVESWWDWEAAGRVGPPGPLTKAVLAPAVGVAPGNRDGDGVEPARLCRVCKNSGGRRGGLKGLGLANPGPST